MYDPLILLDGKCLLAVPKHWVDLCLFVDHLTALVPIRN